MHSHRICRYLLGATRDADQPSKFFGKGHTPAVARAFLLPNRETQAVPVYANRGLFGSPLDVSQRARASTCGHRSLYLIGELSSGAKANSNLRAFAHSASRKSCASFPDISLKELKSSDCVI